MVGLLPLCAVTIFEGDGLRSTRRSRQRLRRFLEARPELTSDHPRPGQGRAGRPEARRDPGRDQAPPCAGEDARREGVPEPLRHPGPVPLSRRASLSCSAWGTRSTGCRYLPAESDTGMFGGNSNWRGPIWMPVNGLIIRALLQYYVYYGDDVHGRVSHGLRAADDPVSGRRGDSRAGWPASSCATTRAGDRSTGEPGSSRRTRTGAITSSSTSTSTATTAPASARATRPDGPASSPAPCICSRP